MAGIGRVRIVAAGPMPAWPSASAAPKTSDLHRESNHVDTTLKLHSGLLLGRWIRPQESLQRLRDESAVRGRAAEYVTSPYRDVFTLATLVMRRKE